MPALFSIVKKMSNPLRLINVKLGIVTETLVGYCSLPVESRFAP